MLYLSSFDRRYILRSRELVKYLQMFTTEVKMLRTTYSYLQDDVNLFLPK